MMGGFDGLFGFLAKLQERSAAYRLSSVRPGALMVEVAVPGERWEVEFFRDGGVEVEVFRSDGVVMDGSCLDDLWARLA